MSHNKNTDALANQAQGGGSGEFKPRVAPDEPMMTGGVCIPCLVNIDSNQHDTQHQPGNLKGNDRIPEFQAETLPPGTAPKVSSDG